MITRKIKIENFFIIFPVLIRTLRTIHNHFLKVTLLRGGLGVLAFQPLQKWCYWRPGFLEFILLLILFKSTTKHSYFTKLKKWWRSSVNSVTWNFSWWNLESLAWADKQMIWSLPGSARVGACRWELGVLEVCDVLVMTGIETAAVYIVSRLAVRALRLCRAHGSTNHAWYFVQSNVNGFLWCWTTDKRLSQHRNF